MSHKIILSVQAATQTQHPGSLTHAINDDAEKRTEISYLVDHSQTPEQAGFQAGRYVTQLLRDMGYGS